MRPTIGGGVLYTRGTGEEWPAHITCVKPRLVGALDVEANHDVYLVVFIHGNAVNPNRSDSIFFTPGPVRFADPPIANTWRWPPRAA